MRGMKVSGLALSLALAGQLVAPAFALDEPYTSITTKRRVETQQTVAPNNNPPSTVTTDVQQTLQSDQTGTTTEYTSRTKSLMIPTNTVLSIKLDQGLDSDTTQKGEPVSATVQEPIYIGPYLVIPAGSRIGGAVTHVNNRHSNNGEHPYIVVGFNTLKRPNENVIHPFAGSLVAYKTGLRGQDYVWALPNKADKRKSTMKSTLGGAVSGLMINPIFGPLVGGAAGFFKNSLTDRIARTGDVEIKANQAVPISIEQAISLPVEERVAIESTAPVPAATEQQTIEHEASFQQFTTTPLSPKSGKAPENFRIEEVIK